MASSARQAPAPASGSPRSTGPAATELAGTAGVATDALHVGLYRFAVATTVATLVLIQLGAMVTSTGSGLAYLDWPTANGSWWPPEMSRWSEGFLEHGHRTTGAVIGLLILALTIWTLIVERRRWPRRWAIGLLALVSVQGVVGGKGVQLGLPLWTSALHGILAQVLLCGLTVFAFGQSASWGTRVALPEGSVGTARRLGVLCLVAIFVQLVLGAVVRHANLHGVLWLHVTVAVAVSLLLLITGLFANARLGTITAVRANARWLLVALAVQLALGIATVAVRGGGKETASLDQLARALVITGHVVVGAVMFLLATLLCARLWRNVLPAPR